MSCPDDTMIPNASNKYLNVLIEVIGIFKR